MSYRNTHSLQYSQVVTAQLLCAIGHTGYRRFKLDGEPNKFSVSYNIQTRNKFYMMFVSKRKEM